MEQFDNLIREMAEKEEMIVPKDFDERIQATLSGLPPKTKKRGLGAVKGALIAAAVCAALMCTAFAASPGLRGMLAEALGNFAPYAHEQEGETYVIDGIEFKVVSALADDFTIRVYIEARDLEGDRLSKLELTRNAVFGVIDVPLKDKSEGSGSIVCGKCVAYDAGTKTALLAIISWGQIMADDLSGSNARVFAFHNPPGSEDLFFWENSDGTAFPVEIEPIPSLVADAELASALQAEEVRLSSLGLSIIFKRDGPWYQFTDADISVRLTDGTLVEAPWEGGLGHFGAYDTEGARTVVIWNFREPLNLEQVVGIYINEEYFPLS